MLLSGLPRDLDRDPGTYDHLCLPRPSVRAHKQPQVPNIPSLVLRTLFDVSCFLIPLFSYALAILYPGLPHALMY
eukprot:1778704-Rhodomonas_salina.3